MAAYTRLPQQGLWKAGEGAWNTALHRAQPQMREGYAAVDKSSERPRVRWEAQATGGAGKTLHNANKRSESLSPAIVPPDKQIRVRELSLAVAITQAICPDYAQPSPRAQLPQCMVLR
jgi:hypothetical protein